MRLYRAQTKNQVIRLSPDPISADDLPAGCKIDEIDRDVPTVCGKVESWQDDEGVSRPHIHYVCPRCAEEHSVDLMPDDHSPRFACCDSCGWGSLVWITWDEKSRPNQTAHPTTL